RIMFVQDKDDMTKVLKKVKPGMFGDEKEWEFQFAWDRHATFLNAQSRAMGELRSLIKQFDQLAHEQDERRLKLEQMRLNIDKTKAEVERLTNKDDDSSFEIIIKDKGGR
ncbi:phage terminase small subunit, partial [Bacillus subtilis]